MYEVLTGSAAMKALSKLLANSHREGQFPTLYVVGYYKENDYYTCFDNTGFSCLVEQAQTEALAISWCNQSIEATELYFQTNEKKFG